MKCLTKEEAEVYLRQVGMKVDEWNRIIDMRTAESRDWVNRQAPRGARELYCFSQHVAGWLPRGAWKLFQIDFSNTFDVAQSFIIGRLLADPAINPDYNRIDSGRLLFEFGASVGEANANELVLSHLIFVFLFFHAHAHITSSGSDGGEILSIQDGFAYFHSREEGAAQGREIISRFESNPSSLPEWLIELEIGRQQQSLGDRPR